MYKTLCIEHLSTSKEGVGGLSIRIARAASGFLRSRRIKYSIQQISLYASMIESLVALKRCVTIDDLVDLAESVFTLTNWNDDIKREFRKYVFEKVFMEKNDEGRRIRLLSRIKSKRTFSLREVLRNPTKEDLLEYIYLRKNGIIKRRRDGRLKVVDHQIRHILEEEPRKKVLAKDILHYLSEIPSEYWGRLLTDEVLNRASLRQLIELARRIPSNDLAMKKRVLEKISDYLAKGWKLKSRERRIVYQLMRSSGYTSRHLSLEMIRYNPSEATSLDRDFLFSSLYNMPLKERMKILPKIYRVLRGIDEKVIESLDLITVSSVKNASSKRLKNMVYLGLSLKNIIKYSIFSDTSYLDYALFYLEKIDPLSLDPRYKPIFESLVAGNYNSVFDKLDFRNKHAVLEYITWITRELNDIKQEHLEKALLLGYRVLRNVFFMKEGEPSGKKIMPSYGERVAVKRTIYRFLRLDYRVLFVKRKKKDDVVVLLDVSGSMLPYSLWATITVATMMYRVKYLILFSESPYVIKVRRKSRNVLLGILAYILKSRFSGYTDIAGAASVVPRIVRRNSIIIVVSDLKQTLPGDPISALERLVRRGHRVIVITHKDCDMDVARELEDKGVEVVTIESPQLVPFILKKKLNLKGGVVKERKRLRSVWCTGQE